MSRVDTHHHVVPPEYAAWLRRRGAEAGGLPIPDWSAEASLALMDERGVETAILSVSTPGVHLGDDARRARDGAPRQRVRRRDGSQPPRALRLLRDAVPSGRPRIADRAGARLRRARRRRRRAAREQPRHLPRRQVVRPGVRGAEPTQGRRLRASLPRPRPRAAPGRADLRRRLPARHDARGDPARPIRHARPLPRSEDHPLPRGRHRSVRGLSDERRRLAERQPLRRHRTAEALLLRHGALRKPDRAAEPARLRGARSRALRQRLSVCAGARRGRLHGDVRGVRHGRVAAPLDRPGRCRAVSSRGSQENG